jgi:nucleotide-binding universal stress UspA family protein
LELFCRDAVSEITQCHVEPDDVIVTAGHPAEEIADHARELHCDIIVMGCHQRSLLKDAVLGSTLRGVLKRTPVPVYVIPVPKGLD